MVFAVAYAVVMLTTIMVAYLVTGDVGDTGLVGVIAVVYFPVSGSVALLLAMGITHTFSWFRMDRELPVRIRQYEDANRSYQMAVAQVERERQAAIWERERLERERQRIEKRQQLAEEEKWTTLSGAEFEEALGDLLEGLGYSVLQTGGAGDEGIDLLVRRGNKTTVVQCKRYKTLLVQQWLENYTGL